MPFLILQFSLGLFLLLVSTQYFVRLAEKISQILKISPLIVGITVVAIGTSLPELAVSLTSVVKHDSGLALGNIIGSNIVNILLVLPIGLFIGNLKIGTTKTQQNAVILSLVTFAFFLCILFGSSTPFLGIALIGSAILVTVLEYRMASFGSTHEDAKKFTHSKKGSFSIGTGILSVLLFVGIMSGSIILVDAVEKIALLTNTSTAILGLTLTAIATSLPELLATIFSQKDGHSKLTIGNILGSNIYNLLMVGGVVLLFPISNTIAIKAWSWLAVSTILLVGIIFTYKGKKLPRWIGVLLMLLGLAYLFFNSAG